MALASSAAAELPAAPPWQRPEFGSRFVVELACPTPKSPDKTNLLPKDVLPPPAAAELVLPAELGAADARPVVSLASVSGEEVPFSLRFDERLARWVAAFPAAAAAARASLYFNPDAKAATAAPVGYQSERRGLFLRTLRLEGSDSEDRFIDLNEVVAEVRGGGQAFGSGDRQVIDDSANPFGPSDGYLSVYQGWLLARRGGQYRFALDADDAGFLLVDGSLAVSFGGRVHIMSGDWKHERALELSAGLHHVAVYHRERVGAQGVRLAWIEPEELSGGGSFRIVPARAFPGAVPARVADTQSRPNASLLDLRAEVIRQVLVNSKVRLALVETTALGAPGASGCSWTVAGRPCGTGATMRAWVPVGVESEVLLSSGALKARRRLSAPEWPDPEALTVGLRFTELAAFLHPDEPLVIGVEAVNESDRPVDLFLSSSLPGNAVREFRLERRSPSERETSPDRVRQVTFRAAAGELAAGARVKLSLGLPGAAVAEREIVLLGSRDEWPELSTGAGCMLCPGGERAVVVLPREDESDYRRWAPLKAVAAAVSSGRSGVVLYGDDLVATAAAGNEPGGGGSGLAAALSKALSGQTVRRQPFAACDSPAIGAVVGADRAAALGAETVILSLGRGHAGVGTAEHVFRRSIDVTIDRLRRGGVRRILVLGPMPDPARPEASKRMSRAASECAAEHHVGYVDLCRLLTGGRGWERSFAAGGGSDARVLGAGLSPEALDKVAAAAAGGL